jgi:hypothetical protein
MPTPTDEQLREYAAKLPAIYRDILRAFPAVAPDRRDGDGLSGPTFEDYVTELGAGHRLGDVMDGLRRLVDNGFLEYTPVAAFYSPTPLGERLVAAVTGHKPAPRGIPDLPVPTWG